MEKWLEKIYEVLMRIFGAISSKVPVKNPVETKPPFRNQRVLVAASQEIGTKEVRGSDNNAKIVKYHSYAREDNDLKKGLDDSVPWCASFVCYCLEICGMGSTNSMAARSFLKWGESVLKNPMPGDIVVYWRGSRDGWQGHVGFYLGETSTHIYTLGGNQSDAVNVSKYLKTKLLDIRRSRKHRKISSSELVLLEKMAEDIIIGHKVNLEGKVV